MPETPYKRTCRTCGEEFLAPSTLYRVCKGCLRKTHDKITDYPKVFYKNRKIAFERDGWTCQCCGCKSNGLRTNSLLCHHLDCDRKNNSPTNLITLCQQCHLSLHRQYDKATLRRSNIYQLFAKEKQFGEFGKNLIYGPARKIVHKRFRGKPEFFTKPR